MKKFFVACLILFICTDITAQFTWLNPTPSGWSNRKILFVNKSTGFLMNYAGDLFITKDTGNTWQTHGRFPNSRTFHILDSIGIIPSNDGTIYLSTDSGFTWNKTIRHPANSVDMEWCDIVGSDTLFVIAYSSNLPGLYRSVNRGTSWQLMNSDVYPLYAATTDFLTAQKGFQHKPDGIYRTIDGGVSWQHLYRSNIDAMKFYDTVRAIASPEHDDFTIRTRNGGISWDTVGTIGHRMNDIFFTDSLTAFAAGESGLVYKTTDGGLNWANVSPVYNAESVELHTQYYFDGSNGIIAGARGRLLRTRDGGASWEKHSPTYLDIMGMSFGNATTGYASIWFNIYKTIDAGKTWRPLALSVSDFNHRFGYCYFSSADTGFVSSYGGTFRTTDGGQTWATLPLAVPVGNYTTNRGIHFFTRDSGYLAYPGSSPEPILYKTTDAGNSWQEVARGQRCDLLFFLNDKFGYSTIYDRVYRTSDGGLTWLQLPAIPPARQPFTAMWFFNPAKGITVGYDGQMKMTLDSGYTWTDIILEPYALPRYVAIRFYNDKIGYTTDEYGGLYKTIDGGYHWKRDATIAADCRSIIFRPDSTVLLAGLGGAIISRDIADYSIDSFHVSTGACSAELIAKVSATLSKVDSTWFEYGKQGYTSTISGFPSNLVDTTIRITTTLTNLQPDSIYHARVKLLYKGKYYYSTDIAFAPQKMPAPVITASGNTLSSSITTGNQWYLNGIPVAGANNQQFNPTATGAYTVRATQGNCTSFLSAPFNYVITAVPDISAWENEIKIFPNPVIHDEINIVVSTNNRRLILQITDIGGRQIKQKTLTIGNNLLSMAGLQTGLYVFSFTDSKKQETVKRKILKY